MARFTEEQQAAIDAQGKTIVSASAGSGKTTVMIEKIIRLIKSGVGVDEILAVTFTKKAAAQMKEKLGKALIESINDPETPAEKRAALKKQLSDVLKTDPRPAYHKDEERIYGASINGYEIKFYVKENTLYVTEIKKEED